MKNAKPRGKTPSLIGSTLGKPKRLQVEKRSSCKRCHGTIEGGTECYAIPQLGSGFTSYKRYCDNCFGAILEKTQEDLDSFRSE